MAIGTLAAIGLGLAGAGAAASSISKNNAANKAAQATTQAADRSAEVIQRNYDLSAQALQPWQQSGLAANAMLNDFYGIQPQQPPQQVAATGMGQFGMANGWNDLGFGGGFGETGNYSLGGMQLPNWQTMSGTATTAAPQANSQDAFRRFIENSDYGFQFGQGANKVNSGYAGAGAIKSGAAIKALEDYRQGLQKGYRGEFLTGLGQQANAGLGAASAQAGVSQNLGNSLANIYTNQGNNLANAALSKTSTVGNSLGLLGGGLFGLARG